MHLALSDHAQRPVILQWPDPILSTLSLEYFGDHVGLDAEIALLDAARRAHQGAGIAAPQLGILHRVCLVAESPDEEPLVLINPRLLSHSDAESEEDEGCLSLAAGRLAIPITRPNSIVIEAEDLERVTVVLELEGFLARVAQHEMDHLDGLTILDRCPPELKPHARGLLERLTFSPVPSWGNFPIFSELH